VIVHGHSLGSFIAGGIAARRPTGGAVLESSATTAEDWVDASHRGIARMLVRVKIDPALRGRGNLSNMSLIDEPLLILVGGQDRTTPPRLSQALYAASPLAPARKAIAVIERANHVDVMDRPETVSAYRAWLARLGG
jgi:pimeloyl-ACP methyl ester carboxylesterase